MRAQLSRSTCRGDEAKRFIVRTLVWFRGKDLRISDHAALVDAARDGELVCLFVLDPFFFSPERAAELPHRMQFLLESLRALAANLAHAGSELFVIPGPSIEVVPKVAMLARADRVFAQRWSEPFGRTRDERVARALGAVALKLYEGETLAPPGALRSAEGRAYSVFTPFGRAHRAQITIGPSVAAPKKLPPAPDEVRRALRPLAVEVPSLEAYGLTPNPNLLQGGERAAKDRLHTFLRERAARYHLDRDSMAVHGTSRLSADLKFGTLSARTVWNSALRELEKPAPEAWRVFSNELLWREFAHAVLWENPKLLKAPHRREFEAFPWQNDAAHWDAWVEGRTGYPVVDASARQLLHEGFVHNRARMISASFLTKHLLTHYQRGEAHYMKFLTDGDWAQNNAGWQWATGCGFDAQPYFRVFNPVLQGERFDPEGDYVRRWVPELASVPAKYIHKPWLAPDEWRTKIRFGLRGGYPAPIVDHAKARQRFLDLAKSSLRTTDG